MDEYKWSPVAQLWLRNFMCFSRSPLVRRSDRLEASVRLLALILALLLIAPAAAFGTSVYDEQKQTAARQSAACGRRAYALGGYVMRDGNIDTIKSVENVEI